MLGPLSFYTMATSKTQLSNLALSRIGETTIVDINDTTNDAARQCKLHLEPVIREVGRAHKWNCLKARAQLAQNVVTQPYDEWLYSYTLPTNCLQLVKVNGYSADTAYIQDNFEIEGRNILTDAEECMISYIEYTDDVTVFDSLLDRAIVTLLASYLASIIAGDDKLAIALRDEFEDVVLPRASRVDSMEQKRRKYSVIANSSFLLHRHIQPGEDW